MESDVPAMPEHTFKPKCDECQNGRYGCGECHARIGVLTDALRELVAWSDQNEPIHDAMRAAKEALNA